MSLGLGSDFGRVETLCVGALAFFLIFIFLPPVYVLTYAFGAGGLDDHGTRALINSFTVAFVVTVVDLLIGLPVSWILARGRGLRFRQALDTLIDMPLVVPTAVLGISTYYFWGDGVGSLLGVEGGLIGKGPILLALLHIVFTFPYVVRSIVAAISQLDRNHEQAATMLGAPPFTVFRTISLPLFRAGVVSGAVLAFTRSLSETGATLMVAGLYSTAPTTVVALKKAGDISSAAAVSAALIASAVIVLLAARLLSGGFRVPVVHVWPQAERTLGRGGMGVRDVISAFAVASLVLAPTFYIVLKGVGSVHQAAFVSLISDWTLLSSIIVSFVLGFAVTAINLAVALPLALLVSRNIFRAGPAVELLSEVILIVPTSALGLSIALFWGHLKLAEPLMLVFAHLSFTFPLMLKPIAAAFSAVDPGLEEVARTLGARRLTVFKTVVYPLIRPAIVAGVIMTFMRSLSETGATLSVSDKVKTVPVLLVDAFMGGKVDDKTTLACILLFTASFILIMALKAADKKNAKR